MTIAATSVEVVLLDPATDAPCGTMEKLQAHREGRYHAAISVLLLDGQGHQLIQRRGEGKYHGAGLWANACCSHPLPGESAAMAARRRLREELGILLDPAKFGTIRYRAVVPSLDGAHQGHGLIENEHVTLFIARFSGHCTRNPLEVSQTSWVQGPTFAAPSHEAPWYGLYMTIFGSDLRAILARSERGTFLAQDFGTFDLVTP